MADMTPTGNGWIANPFGDLINGMLQGHALAHQIKQQAMQEEAFQREKAMQDREMQVKDIQQQMMLNRVARPLSDAGTISDSMMQTTPSAVPGLPDEQQNVNIVRKARGSDTLTD